MIAPEKSELPAFGFATRNRRPLTDPVNAMLSFVYALVVRALSGASQPRAL